MADLDPNSSLQYGRAIKLLVFGTDLNGIDLSNMRIKFSIKRSDSITPNVADILIYNLSEETALQIHDQFKKVILQAGYDSNVGVIFQGNIKQVIIGRESATDTFVNIIAGDGDRAYNFAVVTKTLAAGSTQMDQVNAATSAMAPKGVTAGHVSPMPTNQLPRGKAMYGNARKYLTNAASNTDMTVAIQDEKVMIIPKKSYLPGQATLINSKTGMIGAPQQTNNGVNVKCLLNPNVIVMGRIQIDNKSVQKQKINFSVPGSPANNPAPLTADGVYYVLATEHTGDTRGAEWYTNIVAITISVANNPLNSVQVT